jgi:uncharacterized protein
VRVSPGASREAVEVEDGGVRVRVTALPEGGRANAAVQAALARALGVAEGRLTLVRGGEGAREGVEGGVRRRIWSLRRSAAI